ncbi:MAG: hypothetical protein WBO39_01050, partial [Ferruginibacter sp.]
FGNERSRITLRMRGNLPQIHSCNLNWLQLFYACLVWYLYDQVIENEKKLSIYIGFDFIINNMYRFLFKNILLQ